jgi:hypothetical protein
MAQPHFHQRRRAGQLRDPFAEKRRPWKFYLLLLALLALASLWYVGRLDRFLPEGIRAQDVLGYATPTKPHLPALPSQATGTSKAASAQSDAK